MIYEFYVADESFLDLLAPEDDHRFGYHIIKAADYDEDGNEVIPAVKERKVMRDFLLHWRTSNDGTKICFLLACKHNDHCRYPEVSQYDVNQWHEWLDNNGFDSSKVLDRERFDALMETEEWSVPKQ